MQWRVSFSTVHEVGVEIIEAESHKAAVRKLLASKPGAKIYRVRSVKGTFVNRGSSPVKQAAPAKVERLSARVLRAKPRANNRWRGTTKVAMPQKRGAVAA